ncbi:MAG: hypothetical protein DYG92_06185 [Leptolyngbya sp. PLA1]|nr:hypothetical protein [Leptolyngbya sp. PLA1]
MRNAECLELFGQGAATVSDVDDGGGRGEQVDRLGARDRLAVRAEPVLVERLWATGHHAEAFVRVFGQQGLAQHAAAAIGQRDLKPGP